ncbi:hypothetical protein UFOVP1247_195 [uncultured Caudovirales phage]|uniref:Uncharacterized protein n=1 Tax=uncultured Caudovirales phage TaxID=2100421 RepID=A0A6J5Q258_9CAUD|nr:hypothetical protein UFOVP970_235 [uncultured Caudovirales phage]CAB4193824.1 hypothetical protein UFOVP1247_195 [uncultured Caudovirales phage]
MSLREYRINEMEESDMPFELDESLFDELVELVGSEEDIEEAAEAAYDDLDSAAKNGDVEISDDEIPEKLVIAALLVKLVETGKLGPDDADGLIEKYLG